ncbi:class I SAM-dependent methyltransferase [Halomonas hibernica]|uniref:class I SAM-dependent methyltransferase n=1 Tax=Halomonas hibernica TaxID=2591147 RepID=UPI0015549FF6|nr:class I SAM-dependent methyltransferase [Halomonas hibernica]
MNDWTAGYTASIGYTYGYYNELNPLRIKLAFLNAGLAFPEVGAACELGFGQGVSVNCHAAASTVTWHGTDFNPAQAGVAQALASASGAKAHLHDDAFETFCQRSDLPEFDYIALHGIWSWISDTNREVIVDFLRRKLKVGGVLYISYNTQPGWAAFGPMRHLLHAHSDMMQSASTGAEARVDAAIDFAEQLLATQPGYAKANPHVAERVTALKTQSRQYLAHEYLNRDWLPMHFSEVAQWLSAAKLDYACSAHYPDAIATLNLSQEQQAFLAQLPDRGFVETVRDFMVNQQFRRDYWVKGARTLNSLERTEQLRAQRIVLTTSYTTVPFKVQGALGQAELSEEIYAPLLKVLADHQAHTLAQLEKQLEGQLTLGQIVEAVIVLLGAGHVAPVQEKSIIKQARPFTERLNRTLVEKARGSADITWLASPVTSGGVPVPRFHQLFLGALAQGHKQPEQWAQAAWQLLNAQGQRLVVEGNTLESEQENLAALTQQAVTFAENRLPVLRALQVL